MKTQKGYLRKPPMQGFVAPHAANAVIAAGEARLGDAAMTEILRAAELFRAPEDDEPLREEKAARLHVALFRHAPDDAEAVLADAGRATAQAMMATQLSSRAQGLLQAAPWTVSAWLLGRWVAQHAWMFAGSGRFSVLANMEFQIVDNPVTKGGHDLDMQLSIWQEKLFEELFQELVDPRLICREMQCEAKGGSSCIFAFMLGEAPPEAA